jgi:DNA-binding NarL/FixJ family response regulator
MIRVLLVDDQSLLRMGFRLILEAEPDIEVIGEAADGATGVSMASALYPDVVLMDVRMPGTDGIAATASITAVNPATKVLILTTFDLDEYVYDALAAGADGFLLKDTEPREIIRAVHVVADGQGMLHPAAARRLIDRFHRTARPGAPEARSRVAGLTPREADVLARLAQGDSNAEIAGALGMRESTVKAHVSRILSALGAGNRVQAALLARDAGLGDPG